MSESVLQGTGFQFQPMFETFVTFRGLMTRLRKYCDQSFLSLHTGIFAPSHQPGTSPLFRLSIARGPDLSGGLTSVPSCVTCSGGGSSFDASKDNNYGNQAAPLGSAPGCDPPPDCQTSPGDGGGGFPGGGPPGGRPPGGGPIPAGRH